MILVARVEYHGEVECQGPAWGQRTSDDGDDDGVPFILEAMSKTSTESRTLQKANYKTRISSILQVLSSILESLSNPIKEQFLKCCQWRREGLGGRPEHYTYGRQHCCFRVQQFERNTNCRKKCGWPKTDGRIKIEKVEGKGRRALFFTLGATLCRYANECCSRLLGNIRSKGFYLPPPPSKVMDADPVF